MHQHQAGRGFVLTVLVCFIVAFASFYLMLRLNERATRSPRQGLTANASVTATNLGSSPSSPQPIASKVDPPLELEPQVLLPRTESEDLSKEAALTAGAPLPSITFEAPREQKHETKNERRNGTGEMLPDVSAKDLKKHSQTLEVHADSQGCEDCMNSQIGSLGVPQGCVYFAYTITQVHREPSTAIERTHDTYTSYLDKLESDSSGRVVGATIRVGVRKLSSSSVVPSITMRLTLVTSCPSDTDIGR